MSGCHNGETTSSMPAKNFTLSFSSLTSSQMGPIFLCAKWSQLCDWLLCILLTVLYFIWCSHERWFYFFASLHGHSWDPSTSFSICSLESKYPCKWLWISTNNVKSYLLIIHLCRKSKLSIPTCPLENLYAWEDVICSKKKCLVRSAGGHISDSVVDFSWVLVLTWFLTLHGLFGLVFVLSWSWHLQPE